MGLSPEDQLANLRYDIIVAVDRHAELATSLAFAYLRGTSEIVRLVAACRDNRTAIHTQLDAYREAIEALRTK